MLTPEQKQKIRAREGLSTTPSSPVGDSRLNRFRMATAQAPKPTTASTFPASGFFDSDSIIGSEVKKSGEQVANTFSKAEGPVENVLAAATLPIKAAGTTARIAGRALAEPMMKVAEFIGSPVVEKIDEIVPGFSDEIANNVGGAAEIINKNLNTVKEKLGEDVYNTLVDTVDTLTAVTGGKAAEAPAAQAVKVAKEVAETTAETASRVAKETTENIAERFRPTQKEIDNYVLDKFERGVKPTIVGKTGTLGQADKYKQNAVEAVKIIANNKDNLKFVDDAGEEIVGRTPQSMREFAESIDQTKKSVFEKYNDLAKQAGKAGGEIDGENIVKELDVVKGNKALSVTNPEAIKYADDVQKRLMEFDDKGEFVGYKKFDVPLAQDIVKNYNNSLELFYRNPSYDSASRAAIDAGVVNNFRKSLDDVIENLTGEQYQALKNQYAALKTIEKDVVKRANILARQNNKSLLDYSDIFSGGEMVAGIMTLNPAMFAKGAAQKGIKEWFKYLNSPNRAVKKMFEKVN